jgi:hypothetical protein
MKVSFIEKSFVAILVVILAGITIHTPLTIWLGVHFLDYSPLIKAWKEVLLLLGVLFAAVIITKRAMWRELFQDRLFWLISFFTLLHLFTVLVFYKGLDATAAGLAIDLRYITFFSLIYVAVKMLPIYRRRLLIIASVGACVIVGFAALQLFLPADILSHLGYGKDTIMPYLTVDKNPDYIRVNSTLRGPNPLGAYVVIVLGLFTAALVRKRIQLESRKALIFVVIFGVCSVIALWISYSRSALVAGCMAIGFVLMMTVARRLPRKIWIIVCIIVFAVTGGLITNRESSFVSNVLLHENIEGGSNVSSNEQHASSLAYFYYCTHTPMEETS